MIVPVTRKEKLLNAIATNGNVDFSPKTREELFLFKILGADVNTPTPITRKELLYQHVADGTIPTFEPQTRLEKFIMAAAGVELELPAVLTREEYWWAEIADSNYETITGAIVHFISKRARAIKSLIANIAYTQDLNGYSYPWPAGGGKNLLDSSTNTKNKLINDQGEIVTNNAIQITDFIPVSASTAYVLSGTGLNGSGSADVRVNYYDSNKTWKYRSGTNKNNGLQFTTDSDTAYVRHSYSNNATNEQLELGTTATSYAPYSNICPISGFTSANVTRTGKNLLPNNLTFTNGVRNDDGNHSVSTISHYTNAVPIKSNTVYTFKGPSNSNYRVYFLSDGQSWISRTDIIRQREFSFTTQSNCKYIQIQCSNSVNLETAQLELGSTATDYEPYQGNTYDIVFPALGKNLLKTTEYTNVTRARLSSTLCAEANEIVSGKSSAFAISGKTTAVQSDGNVVTLRFEYTDGTNTMTTIYRGDQSASGALTGAWSIVSTAGKTISSVSVGGNTGSAVLALSELQLELGSTATDYEPYTNTVYGGTLDVVSGLLTVDRAGVDLGTLTWKVWYTETNNKTIRTNLPLTLPHAQTRKIISENYKYQGTVAGASVLQHPDNLDIGLRTYYKEDRLGYDDIVYAVIPVSESPDGLLVYELATPQTYQLTPTEVTTLLGDNTIWADTGDVTVTY